MRRWPAKTVKWSLPMIIRIPYGNTTLEATLDGVRVLDTLDIAEAAPVQDVPRVLSEGLADPIGLRGPLSERLKPGQSVLILVSDSFRKTGVDRLLPTLLHYLVQHGIAEERISFLFASGTHRPPTPDEQSAILGAEVFEGFRGRAFTHDPGDADNLVFRGTTSRGTPVYVNRRAVEADCVISTGAVVLHYFGGFGGGRKSIVPGIAGTATIAANHSLNLDPEENRLNPDVAIGRIEGNPVAEDMLEAALRCRCDFLINTVLNRQGDIAGIFCGGLVQAHAAACASARALYAVAIPEQADLVIASAGAAKNFIQSHKALYNAYQATRPGGRIILAAPAPEGYGGARFQEWLALGTREAIIAELRKNAEINGQTALSTREKARNTLFITELSARETEYLGGRKAETLAAALASARSELAGTGIADPTCYIMSSASYTVPILQAAAARAGPPSCDTNV